MGAHRNETRYFEIKNGERVVLAYSMALNGRVHTVSLATVLRWRERRNPYQLTRSRCASSPERWRRRAHARLECIARAAFLFRLPTGSASLHLERDESRVALRTFAPWVSIGGQPAERGRRKCPAVQHYPESDDERLSKRGPPNLKRRPLRQMR